MLSYFSSSTAALKASNPKGTPQYTVECSTTSFIASTYATAKALDYSLERLATGSP